MGVAIVKSEPEYVGTGFAATNGSRKRIAAGVSIIDVAPKRLYHLYGESCTTDYS